MSAKNAIDIGDGMSLPVEYITTTAAILAKKRVGKTYLAQKIAEGLLAAGQQVVVIDMTSAWWGLRSSADGKSPGYPITIFGGRHGDVPLEATAGEMLANAIVADRFSAVLDVRLLKKGQRIRFIADFLEALYDKNTTAMHLFMDEADAYIPQRSFSPEEARALGAADELVRRGGIGGIGVTMITQRAAVLNKNVLSQVDTLAILRMNHPKDIDSVTDWMEHHTTDKNLIAEIAGSISSLSRGEAWWLDPEHKTFKKITVSAKSTYDSGRTPKVGEQVKAPKVLAKVDLDRLGASIQDTVERQKASDPKVLKLRVAELEKQLAAKIPAAKPGKVVEKLVVTDSQLAKIGALIDRGEKAVVAMADKTSAAAVSFGRVLDSAGAIGMRLEAEIGKLRTAIATTNIREPQSASTARPASPISRSVRISPPIPPKNIRATGGDPGDPDLTGPERRILEALAWMDGIGQAEPPIEAVAFLADYRPGGGAFNNTRGALRAKGYVDYPSAGALRLTELGRAAAPTPSIPGSGDQLRATVIDRLAGPERKLLEPLIDAYPGALTTEELAERSGYGAGGGAFNNTRGRLRTLGLADYPRPGHVRAADLLFPEGA